MKKIVSCLGLASLMATGGSVELTASSHREAPITALNRSADVTDVYAFRTGDLENPTVTFIVCVDPLLEPANGPNYFPFDPSVRPGIRIDNNHDGIADLGIDFEFNTELRLPGVYTTLVGFEEGAHDPETGDLVVPPQINDFDDVGLGLRQSYSVTIKKPKPGNGNGIDIVELFNNDETPFYAVPANPGPRTMVYSKLYEAGTYTDLNVDHVKVFAGSVDDPFFIDLGAAFDTANLRPGASTVPGVLTDEEDMADENFNPDDVAGYAVNAIAVELPVHMITSDGKFHDADDPEATIGFWGVTNMPRVRLLSNTGNADKAGFKFSKNFRQMQRLGHPLINELIIGTGSKDLFSTSKPHDDGQFADFFLNPVIAQAVEALYNELLPGALDVPEAPRTDLLPLVLYLPPIAAPGTPEGPIADMLRLNTGVEPTHPDQTSRLGLIGGDPAGYPNGRRLADDVVDIVLRVGVGGVLHPDFGDIGPNNRLGDGVNVNNVPFNDEFPYLAHCPDGRDSAHDNPENGN